jgi:hypothetical protein
MEDGHMRGRRNTQIRMLAFIDLEERIPTVNPLRTLKRSRCLASVNLNCTGLWRSGSARPWHARSSRGTWANGEVSRGQTCEEAWRVAQRQSTTLDGL